MNQTRHLIMTLALLMIGVVVVMAQGTVTGKVTDDKGEPIIGATIVVKGTTVGSSSDLDGNYEIKNVAPGNVTLVASYVGYTTKEAEVTVLKTGAAVSNISLSEDSEIIDEVVVVGYGVQRKRDLVGSVAKVEEINDLVGASFQTALQGKAAGVQVTQSSGMAGAGAVIRIRGVGSLSANGDPLYVVDGIPIMNNNFQLGNNSAQNNNPLSFINPNDIQSIEVLKDASAAAIYGSRGANGVILVTTKRAGAGNSKPKFTYSNTIGVGIASNRLDVLNAQQFLGLRQTAWENDGNAGRAALPRGLTYNDIKGVNTDWIDLVLRTGFKQEHNLGMTVGSKYISAYAGISYLNSDSYIKSNNFERMSGRLNLDIRPMKNLTISLNTSLARSLTSRVGSAWSGGLGWAQTSALPIYPVTYDPLIANALAAGDTVRANNFRSEAAQNGGYYNKGNNPLAQLEHAKQRVLEWRSVNNLSIRYQPTKQLTFSLNGSFEYQRLSEHNFEDKIWTNTVNIAKEYAQFAYNYNVNPTIQYDFERVLPKKHRLTALLGAEYQNNRNEKDYYKEYNGVSDFLFTNPNLNADGVVKVKEDLYAGQDKTLSSEQFFSYFGRVNYNFNSKFFAQVTMRSDASSRFGRNNRWGYFPSVGVGYVMTEEPFLKNNKVLNFLKFKASWGLRGVAGIPTQEQYGSYSISQNGYITDSTRVFTKIPNPDLKWDLNSTYDGGFEFGLFNDRITGDFTFYHSTTSQAVIKTRIQASAGQDNTDYFVNLAEIRNMGFELGLKTRNLVGAFQWNTTINAANNQNKLISVGYASPDALDGGFGDQRALPGYSMGVNNILTYSGVDPQTGNALYRIADGTLSNTPSIARDRTPQGGILPYLTLGVTNEFKYKNFDFSFMFYGSFGGNIYMDDAKRLLANVDENNKMSWVLDRYWQGAGDTRATLPRPSYTSSAFGFSKQDDNNSSLWLQPATYVRLRTITFGYTIPKGKIAKLDNIRVYFSATNLLTFTDYIGWDPEVARDRENNNGSGGQQRNIGGTNVTYLTPPQEKAFTFGMNVQF